MVQTVSVLVPIYNRAAFLERCLAPLMRQTYPTYEILVIDDGSTDNSAEKARQLAQGWSGTLRVIQQQNGGPASARNAGIFASKAQIVAFIDSDCIAAENWLECLVRALEESGAAGVGGLINDAVEPGETMSWVSHYLAATKFFRQRVKNGVVDYLLTSNAAFRREAMVAVNGFRVRRGAWSEDADLSFRLVAAGYRLAVTEIGAVQHFGSPSTVKGLARMTFRYGRGNMLLSTDWNNGRTPLYELIRHLGAVVLSPPLALRWVPQVGVWHALSFWPLVVIEHSAFVAGVVAGLIERRAAR